MAKSKTSEKQDRFELESIRLKQAKAVEGKVKAYKAKEKAKKTARLDALEIEKANNPHKEY